MSFERKLVLSKAFEKSYQKFTSKNQVLKISIVKALLKLQYTMIEKDFINPDVENIILLDIGTHDDVY